MKKFLATASLGLLAAVLVHAPAAFASAPSLQVAPLQYTATLKPGTVSSAFIDVSNPADASVDIISEVKGFRQVDQDGNLGFFDDPDYATAIKVGLPKFTLGPREAIRVVFTVDASKLPQGGVYAAIFFQTVPREDSSSTSYVRQSANVGTLLSLTNGDPHAPRGDITRLDLPFWQFGSGITGSLTYRNTDSSKTALAFKPTLTSRVTPWGRAVASPSGLILPLSTRKFELSRPGAFFGLLPVTLTNSATHHHRTAWVFAVTGWYQWGLPVLIIVILFTPFGLVASWPRRIWRKFRYRPGPKRKSLDGLSIKK